MHPPYASSFQERGSTEPLMAAGEEAAAPVIVPLALIALTLEGAERVIRAAGASLWMMPVRDLEIMQDRPTGRLILAKSFTPEDSLPSN